MQQLHILEYGSNYGSKKVKSQLDPGRRDYGGHHLCAAAQERQEGPAHPGAGQGSGMVGMEGVESAGADSSAIWLSPLPK